MALNNFMKLLLLLLSCLLLASCQSPIRPTTQKDFLIMKLDSIIEGSNFNGVVLLSDTSGHFYSKANGYSDLETKAPIQLHDQFVIGSISKQITATLVLHSYEKGNIGLNHSIDQYLTTLDQPWAKQVTVHQLLTHTHGIVALDQPLAFQQGTQFQYSQLGYDLLARILEKVSHKSFKELSTQFFEQHQLNNTFHPDHDIYQDLVQGYEASAQAILEPTPSSHSLSNYAAAGSFISNAEDLTTWNHLLHSEQLIKKETLGLMQQRYASRIHPIFDTVEYGYGLLFKDGEQSLQIGALGYAPGFVSASYYYPKKKISLIILSNTAHSLGDFRQTFNVHTAIMKLVKEYSFETKHKIKVHSKNN